jgi:demethylmenaquinone methyltransferase/2-methoxy-6-polyprenyl-1,4-benzoquinol methylase
MESERGRTEEEREYYALSTRAYAIFAPFYDLVTLPFRRLRDEVVSTLSIDRTLRALDVATGTGAQARAFAEKAAEVVGIDLSEAMLRIARRKHRLPNLTFRRADAAEMPFDDRSFDVACISFALHEMPRSIRERVVREMVRVTKPGGAILVVDYGLPRSAVMRWLVYHVVKLYEPDHYADFVRSDVQALLRDAGVELQAERPAPGGLARIYSGHRCEVGDATVPSSVRGERAQGQRGEADRAPRQRLA